MNLYQFSFLFFFSLCSIIPMAYAQSPSSMSPLEIRALQTREFTGINKDQAITTGLATFQDLGFIITETSAPLGLIKANQTRPKDNMIIQATLTLIPAPTKEQKIIARLSLTYSPFYAGEEGANLAGQLPRESTRIQTPTIYQQFFQAFSNSMHLKSNL